MKTESNNKSKLSLFYASSLTTRLTIVYFGVSVGIALQIGAANWDIIWHGITDVESFFTPPHTVLYSGVALTIGSVFIGIIQYLRLGGINGEKEKQHEKQPEVHEPSELTTIKKPLTKVLGGAKQNSFSSSSLLTSFYCLIQTLCKMPYPIKLVTIGTIIEIFSGGFDSWWHYNFGFDGLLSPPHLMLTIGMLTAIYGTLIGIYKLLHNNNNKSNSRSTLLKISFIVAYAVAWIVSVNTIFMFSLPYSKGQYFDFNPNPFAAILIASVAIPFFSGMLFYSAAKTLGDVHFRFTFITLAFMIIHSTATIISNSHFAILYPLYLLNIIPALAADIFISSKRNQYYGRERNAHFILETKRAGISNLLRNQRTMIFCSAIVPMIFITLFFPWSVNTYKEFFGINMNTFESITIFNQLLWPFIIPYIIPVSVLMSIMGSYIMSRILGKLLEQDVHGWMIRAQTVLGPALISVHVLSGIFMLFLVTCNFMLTATAAQSNNNDTNPVLKAIQEASPTNNKYLKAKVIVKAFDLNADIPIISEQMSKGLAVKNQLKENEAMLFVFEKPGRHSFWMKDMKFPIDIFWLDSDGKVVYIKKNMQPCISTIICILYTPNTDSQYVLETVAGFTQRHNVSVGTNIDFELVK